LARTHTKSNAQNASKHIISSEKFILGEGVLPQTLFLVRRVPPPHTSPYAPSSLPDLHLCPPPPVFHQIYVTGNL